MRHLVVLLAVAAGACQSPMEPIHVAAATGDVEFVKTYIAKKGKLDVTFDEPSRGLEGNAALLRGITPLMMAARGGQLEIVKLLVENGANLYAEARPRDERPDWSFRRTAFDFTYDNAMDRGVSAGPIFQYLWEKSDGVRFAARLAGQIDGTCARYCNDKSGDARTNPALVLIGVSPDEPRGRGISQAVCRSQRPMELLAFLDRHVARYPKNTLHCAAYGASSGWPRSAAERIAIAEAFLARGADLEDLGISRYATPLMAAASVHDAAMVKFLLSRGANPNTRNSVGYNSVISAGSSCIHSPAGGAPDPRQQAQLATIEMLLQAGGKMEHPGQGTPWLMRDCCKQEPRSAIQRQICRIYGL